MFRTKDASSSTALHLQHHHLLRLPTAEKAVTARQAQPQQKRRRGTAQLTTRRPSVAMGGSGGTGVQLSQ